MGSRLSTDARLMTSTTLLIRGSPLAAINRRSRASAEPRYRAVSFPSALYPVRVDTTAGLSSTERGSGSLAMRSSHARSSSSSAAGVASVFTSASTQPRAAFGHLAFNSPAIFISVIAPQLNRTIQDCRHCQLLQAPDVRHEPLNFLGLQTLSIGRHFVFSFFDHRPQVGVGLAGNRWIAEAHDAHAFPRWRVSLAACAMAYGALRLVQGGTLFICFRSRTQGMH